MTTEKPKRRKASQIDIIKAHLETFGSISSWEAIQLYRITRLSAIMYRLKAEGIPFTSEMSSHIDAYGERKNFATYRMAHSTRLEATL